MAVVAVLALGCSGEEDGGYGRWLDDQETREIRENLPFESVSLFAQGCYGICPVYRIELHRDGSAVYEGLEFVPLTGKRRGTVSLADFARVCTFLETFGFADLRSRYAVEWTDAETVAVRAVRRDGGEIRVEDYGGAAPQRFEAVRLLLADMVDRIQWEPVGGR